MGLNGPLAGIEISTTGPYRNILWTGREQTGTHCWASMGWPDFSVLNQFAGMCHKFIHRLVEDDCLLTVRVQTSRSLTFCAPASPAIRLAESFTNTWRRLKQKAPSHEGDPAGVWLIRGRCLASAVGERRNLRPAGPIRAAWPGHPDGWGGGALSPAALLYYPQHPGRVPQILQRPVLPLTILESHACDQKEN